MAAALRALSAPASVADQLTALLAKLQPGTSTVVGEASKTQKDEKQGDTGKKDAALLLDAPAFRELVAWLEDAKIRAWPIDGDGRAALRRTGDDGKDAWMGTFGSWIEEIECPYEVRQGMGLDAAMKLLTWLLSEAVSIEYADNRNEIESALFRTRKRKRLQSGGAADVSEDKASDGGRDEKEVSVAELESDLFRKITRDVVKEILPGDDAIVAASLEKQLQKLVSHVRTTMSSEGADRCEAPGGSKESEGGASAKLERATRLLREFPLGFSVEGAEDVSRELVDAVRVLRLLYAADLRKLQSQVDEFVVEGQSFTANPKTDSRLGKVGR